MSKLDHTNTVSPAVATAAAQGLALCKACHELQHCSLGGTVPCMRCGASVSVRTLHSVKRTWFFLVMAVLLLIPANTLPMMSILLFGRGEPSTIIGGVALMVHHGIYAIAAVVFIASFVVPIFKITCIIILLLSVQRRWDMNRVTLTRVYRVVEFLGRWSMLDVFVVAVLVGLVQLGQVVTVEAGMGIMAFGIAVILTMLSSMSFDPRLIWDVGPAVAADNALTSLQSPSISAIAISPDITGSSL